MHIMLNAETKTSTKITQNSTLFEISALDPDII